MLGPRDDVPRRSGQSGRRFATQSDTTHTTRISAISTLAQLAALPPSRLDQRNRTIVRANLLAVVKDGHASVRMRSVDGLAHFADGEVRAVLEKVAARDAHMVIREGRAVYPLREQASAALRSQERAPLR